MAVCSEIHTKHINTVCGQNVELLNVKLHYVQRYRSPSTYPPQQQDTICCKYLSLTLLMMGKILPETC